ncbi:hypothetical protein RKD27_006854 [Streptomyces sp. SAI-126]
MAVPQALPILWVVPLGSVMRDTPLWRPRSRVRAGNGRSGPAARPLQHARELPRSPRENASVIAGYAGVRGQAHAVRQLLDEQAPGTAPGVLRRERDRAVRGRDRAVG